MKDECKISDVFFAAFLHYNGLPVMKIVNYERMPAVWFFSVPSLDLQIMQDEFVNKEQAIYVEAFVNSIKHVQRLASLARQHCGEFLTREYRQFIGI